MQRLRIWASVCAVVLGLALGARADCSNPQTIKELRDCWQESWKQKDLTALLSLYSDNASLLTGDGSVDGIVKIKAYLQTKINLNTQFVFTTVSHIEPSEYGYDSGTFQQTIPQSQPQDGSYLLVAQKGAKGRLRIIQHAFVTKRSAPVTAPCVTCFL
jgi:ketosteroid isomerase-like protein